MLEGELQALAVVLGEGADAQVDAGQIEPLARTQLAADQDLAATSFPRTSSTSSWISPSLRNSLFAVPTDAGRRAKVDGDAARSPTTLSRGQRERSPGSSRTGSGATGRCASSAPAGRP